ncbi:MAG: putative metal-binding motif-containing protein, partial [Nanoarchaeota archaeon]
DLDCCNLKKEVIDPYDSTRTITLEGIDAADSEEDGCCKATCDAVCDPDCLLGQDPDCLFDPHLMLSPNEWAAKIGKEDMSEKDFFSGSDTGKCVGCGNGRCEFNVWGGGRFDRPTIGSFKNPSKHNFVYAQGQWQIPPSMEDMIAHNWYYIKDLKTDYVNPISQYPYFFSRWSFSVGLAINRFRQLCDIDPSDDEDGYNTKVYERIWADCMQVIHYVKEKKGYSVHTILKGKSISQSKKSDFMYSKGRSIVEGGEATFSFMPDKKIEPKFSKLVDDFQPFNVAYPYDETPDNCPQDCGREVTCSNGGNGVCEPWEFVSGTCEADCSDASSDYKMKLPLQFWVSEIQDLKDDEEGYCITKERFQEHFNWFIEYNDDQLGTSHNSDFSPASLSTKALCAFAHPGEQGNCPSGSICGYNCECIAFSDFEKIPGILDKAAEQGVSISGEDFYRSLEKFVDKDMDTFHPGDGEGYDCDDSNTFINPDAADVCDGIDNDCDEDVDEIEGGSPGSACDKSVWVCKEAEPSFRKIDALTGQVAIGCLNTFCHHDKGDEETKEGRTMFCEYPVDEQEPKNVPYYIYVCDPDDPSDECKLALQNSFEICNDNESGMCTDGRDNDCDGLIDMKDSDCFTCNPDIEAVDRCRLIEKQWCMKNPDTEEAELVSDGYCGVDACGLVDSSCAEGAGVCAEGEKSCGKGCLPGACDIFANKTCNENGV